MKALAKLPDHTVIDQSGQFKESVMQVALAQARRRKAKRRTKPGQATELTGDGFPGRNLPRSRPERESRSETF